MGLVLIDEIEFRLYTKALQPPDLVSIMPLETPPRAANWDIRRVEPMWFGWNGDWTSLHRSLQQLPNKKATSAWESGSKAQSFAIVVLNVQFKLIPTWNDEQTFI